MNLTLIITNNCSSCKRVETQLKQFASKDKHVNLLIENLNNVKYKGIVIVPALLIEEELFAYGDVDEEKLLNKLKHLHNT